MRERKINMHAKKPTDGKEAVAKLLHSKAEAAQMLDISLRTVDNLIALKELPVRRILRRVLIPHSALLNFIRTDHLDQEAAA
jgi:excisionase family DNA binding protein